MHLMAQALCYMSDSFGMQMSSLSVQIAGTSTLVNEIREDQVKLNKRVDALENRKCDAAKNALDAGITAITRTKQCEPFKLVLADFPEMVPDLIPDAVTQIGASLGLTFGPDLVKSARRGKPRAAREP